MFTHVPVATGCCFLCMFAHLPHVADVAECACSRTFCWFRQFAGTNPSGRDAVTTGCCVFCGALALATDGPATAANERLQARCPNEREARVIADGRVIIGFGQRSKRQACRLTVLHPGRVAVRIGNRATRIGKIRRLATWL
jgi:hypothetical protein